MELKDKKILLVGLGILGGGHSMAKYLLKKGANLTVTDLRDKKTLEPMIKKLPTKIKYTLGKHKESDFQKADIIIFNPAVSVYSPWAKLAKKLKKPFFNDYTFFLEELKNKNQNAPRIIGVTGTRGKTTTTNWCHYFMKDSEIGGNIPEKNLLKILGKKTNWYVLELSSFQLEYVEKDTPAPKIAILTNIYNDHLNRYGTFDRYAKMKFNIFQNQTKEDFLILNADEKITKEVLKLKPKSKIYFVQTKKLPKNKYGIYFAGDDVYLNLTGDPKKIFSLPGLAPHEKSNLLSAILAAHLAGTKISDIKPLLKNLPQISLRQETIIKNNKYLIINDSAGTSPDATIAAIEKFKGDDFVLISGGTDKVLDFSDLTKKIVRDVPPKNLYLLGGSATVKLKKELKKFSYPTNEFQTLEEIIKNVSKNHKTGTIVFSPGAASFEKFKNEFDRGQKFKKLAAKYFKL